MLEIENIPSIHLRDVTRDMQNQLDANNEFRNHWFKFFTINGHLKTIEKGYPIALPHKNTKQLAKDRMLRNIKDVITGKECLINLRLLIGYDKKKVRY
ncbi:MAG: hypothetical protein VB122_07395 [Erysipelotrichales bacterium]|nr:hypothetical protein [Erysipelotrichales bacterium]